LRSFVIYTYVYTERISLVRLTLLCETKPNQTKPNRKVLGSASNRAENNSPCSLASEKSYIMYVLAESVFEIPMFIYCSYIIRLEVYVDLTFLWMNGASLRLQPTQIRVEINLWNQSFINTIDTDSAKTYILWSFPKLANMANYFPPYLRHFPARFVSFGLICRLVSFGRFHFVSFRKVQ